MEKRNRSGTRLETIVARIQQMMDPNSKVTHNETLEDRIGNKRQYDIVIRGRFGGRNILGVVECKDHSRRKGPDAVEAFAKKTEHLGANLRIIVSKRGFTKQALRLAKHEGIGCLSLLPGQSEQVGFSVGDMWYGVVRKWTNIQLTIHFAMPTSPVPTFDVNKVKFDGKLVMNWFLKELFTTYGEDTTSGDFGLTVKFETPRNVEVEGQEWPVAGITCTARRIYKKKRKWVSWSGDAFFDWHTNQIALPAKGTVVGSAVETDLEAWPNYDGDIPALGTKPYSGFLCAVLYDTQKWNTDQDDDVPQLSVFKVIVSGRENKEEKMSR